MTPELAKWIRLSISSLVSGIIAGGGALLSAITAAGNDGTLTRNSVLFAIVTGVIIAGNDIKSRLTEPPTSVKE